MNSSSAVAVAAFNKTLISFLRTLSERCADDKDLISEFKAAIVVVEAAQTVAPQLAQQMFVLKFLDPRMVKRL